MSDLALLGRALIRDYPVAYSYNKIKEFTVGPITQPNRNLLLWRDPSVDGIKTGHTDEAGWCLAASATRDGRSIVAVVLGAPTEQARDDAARALLDYGFQQTVTDLSGAGDGAPSTNGQVEPEPADEDVVNPGHPPASLN